MQLKKKIMTALGVLVIVGVIAAGVLMHIGIKPCHWPAWQSISCGR